MDGGPFRVQRPADRRVASRPEPAPPRPPEEPQSIQEEPKTVHRPTTSHNRAIKEEKSFKRFLLPIIGALVVIFAAIGWFTWSNMQNAGTAIDSGKYQAVFFTNGQVYFGKLHPFNSEYMKLTDVYYLQSQANEDADSKNPQKTTADQGNVQLIKLGDEIHGPKDEMIISKSQLLFYENLKSDGKVAQSIEKFKTK